MPCPLPRRAHSPAALAAVHRGIGILVQDGGGEKTESGRRNLSRAGWMQHAVAHDRGGACINIPCSVRSRDTRPARRSPITSLQIRALKNGIDYQASGPLSDALCQAQHGRRPPRGDANSGTRYRGISTHCDAMRGHWQEHDSRAVVMAESGRRGRGQDEARKAGSGGRSTRTTTPTPNHAPQAFRLGHRLATALSRTTNRTTQESWRRHFSICWDTQAAGRHRTLIVT